ncbi:2-dehydro-3-deoxygalactonokinase [Aliiroseovarius sp. S1339]|uniref:2-dehydro-3-deoxygalactonokinase n=1 Tax=Aliiroseovarius sp. S1339 TaxID=2936990 RepID=UPI0020BD97C4|nr:2-dehydro-3-deoxygalactonokinase [Aliiroseovarius sp. S1339]MCK8464983.1 2-dehydro-3-deoxygalactonokinase [Aliiroseovarius sp. S1339]
MKQPILHDLDGASNPAWIAVDWGATHLNVWLMDAEGAVLEKRTTDKDMGDPRRVDIILILQDIQTNVPADMPLPTIICGMDASPRDETPLPYATVPCPPPDIAQATRIKTQGLDMHILPGVKQTTPADVMRGEETRIAGFLSHEPDFDGILCLPGAHTKWVHISAGEIVSFRTFITGELFALLSSQSALRHAVATDEWDQTAFDAGLADTMSRPADLAAKLFSLRAEGVLNDLPPATARARLSALLIGAELAAAKPYWLGQEVVVLGETGMAAAYQTALAAQGVAVRSLDATGLTLVGLIAAYRRHADPQNG